MNQRKEQIIDVAHRLFIQKGFTATSVKDILVEADIAKGTFYNHFASKNECLIAILEIVREEAQIAREEISFGKAKDDPDLFVQQVLIRMEMNRKQTLLPLFESVYNSKDEDIKEFIRKQHSSELQWVSARIVDLFGDQTKDYALDYASIFFGVVHHMMHVWRLGTTKHYQLRELVYFSLKQLQAIISYQDTESKPFFPADWLKSINQNTQTDSTDIKKQLLSQLEILLKRMDEMAGKQGRKERFEFLHAELQADTPRDFLIESVLHSIIRKSDSSFFKNEVQEIIQLGQQYLKHHCEAE